MKARIPFLLKQLEDYGWDAERIGRSIGQPATKVRAYRRGYVTPDRKTGLEIEKVVSCLQRRMMPPGHIPPRIVAENTPVVATRVHPMRGVYEEEVADPGQIWYKVVTSEGDVGLVHLPAKLCDESLFENLWRRLNAKDPVRQLHAI